MSKRDFIIRMIGTVALVFLLMHSIKTDCKNVNNGTQTILLRVAYATNSK